MIANNSTNKLKASKGFKESESIKLLVSEDKTRTVERGEGDKDRYSGENQSKSSFSSSVVYSRERTVKPRSRHRDDFRAVRGTTERRGGSARGRGAHRKFDKDGEIFSSRGKFQEPLIKGRSNDGVMTVSSSKYDVEGGKSKSADFGGYGSYISLPEDSRISKVLRRMSREEDNKNFIHHCTQLQEAIVAVDNARYIRRALDLICDSLLDLLHSGPSVAAKILAAKCLGRLGYTLDQDFKRFMDWVFQNYTVERNDDVRGLLLQGVLETVRLEREQPRLKEFASALMNHLHVTLEAVDKAHLLIVAAEVILDLASIYPDLFTKYFTDTVDILVGWHIDLTTPVSVVCFANQSLQRLSPYWVGDIDFSLMMLGHFVEDTENYSDDTTDTEHSSPTDDTPRGLSLEQKVTKVTAFIKVFNAVMKGLGQHLSPSVSPAVTWNFLYECLARMLAVVLKMVHATEDLELLVTGNECTWLLLNLLQNKTCPAHEDLYQLIYIEINMMDKMNNVSLSSTLQLVAKVYKELNATFMLETDHPLLKPSSSFLELRLSRCKTMHDVQVVKELSANLPLELVQQVLKPGSTLQDLRLSSCKTVHVAITNVYHSLLSLKNIPLLKEVYRLIMTDLDCAFRVILPDLEPLCAGIEPTDCYTYSIKECENIICFHLKALSNIANASNSLIGMWLLQPSILDLLATRLIPQSIGRVSSTLLYAELYLLYSHCSRHSHFITTSSLVGGSHGRPTVNSLLGILSSEMTQPSPNSGHFSVILSLLSNIVTQDLCEESSLLMLTWSCELLGQSRPYFTSLASTSEMIGLVMALCTVVDQSFSNSVLLAACASLEQLLIAPYTLYWKRSVLERIVDVCLLHVNSSHSAVGARYSALLLRLPWTIVIPSLAQGVPKRESARGKLHRAQHTLISQDTNTGEMTPHYFKLYMAHLLKGVNSSGSLDWLQDVFTCCWSLSQCEPHDYGSARELALSSVTVLLQWATWEAAQLCVNNKLRTPLGKPLDTFMAFEGAIKSLARQTVGSSSPDSAEDFGVSRVRLLLELVEQLEKTMYNASDGTATALISPAKPVRTFFHTNKSTCCEWLSRNRSALVGVALHAGMASAAVRYGYALLQDLLDLGNTKGSEFESAVLQTGWALLQLKQSKAIQGLYVWCRDIIGLTLPYLKALADEASGKLETAVETYTKLINNESVESPTRQLGLANTSDSHDQPRHCHSVKTLLADQITECYLSLQDWTQLARWKVRERDVMSNENGATSSRYKYLTAKDAEAYLEFDREDWSAANELLEWSTAVDAEKPTWDCFQLLGRTRQKLANIAIKSVASGIIQDSDRDVLRECHLAAHCYLVEGLRNTPSEVVQEAAILEFAANAMLSESDVIMDYGIDGSITCKQSNVDSRLLSRILSWGQVLERLQITSQPSPQLSLDAARLARKEGNFKLSLRQLSHHLNHILHQDNGHRTTLVLTNDILGDMDKCMQPWNLPHAKAFTEVSKLLYSVGQQQLAVEVGAKTCMRLVDSEEVEVKERCSRLLLTVAKWLPSLDPSAVPVITEPLADWHREIDLSHSLLDILDFNLEGDSVGVVLQLAVSHCPSLAKAWTSLANWAYRWGRKVTDQVFTPADKEIIDTLIPNEVDKEQVYSVLTHHTPPVDDDDDIEVENLNVSDMIEWQLQSFGTFTPEQLSSLVEMWRKSHARTYNFYQLSAYSYFKYLQLCENPQEDSHAITATLRLLRLIVKHAQELQAVLEVGLANTPTLPWVCIIPQLFSRLSHPQPYVRRRVSELLCRLAADKPHLIIFPSVVGSDAGAATIRDMPHTKLFSTSKREVGEDLDIVEEEDEEFEEDEDESHNGDQTQAMENCFQAMVDILAKQDPEAITQVQVFVRELRRITLLWDELWLGTLAQHHADMSRRISYLEQEVVRVDDNADLSPAEKDRLVAEKHRIILKPLLFVLEQLHAITSVPAETPHEIAFQEKFGANIAEVLEKLRSPADPRKPGDAWSALKGLQMRLQQRVTKRASYSLRMRDISPTLAELRNTQIAMPGCHSLLTIAAIQDHIAVLPTKTKPKKLVFQGSDGKSYTYLFKGLEDLHLDERIMQFLSIANTMLRGTEPGLQARHYAVIPLGLRSGLISWVQGVTPLFSLYKRWQQRQASISQSTVMRPSEMFYSKLTPLLKDCDVTKPESRNTWPVAVLKQVLMELMQETPTYLLSRELWCDSVNAGGWWQSTKLYSTSLAVMSIIGYIIGLGDRHLDNVLVDLATGQVVHIDYNVCFEKGKSLRVPEKVPFRLTPNLRAALGVTGVEGIFRLTCEHVLKVMKKGRETVLTLLEAFVYDPLIDWTPGSETGYTGAVYGGGRAVALETRQSRKQLEKEVTVDMLAVRLAEMKYEWLDNRDKLVVELPDLAGTLDKWLNESGRLKRAEEALQERHQQMALVKEAEAHSQHALYTLPVRYAANCAATDASNKARVALQAKVDESARSIQQYKMALYYFYGPQMAQWLAEVNTRTKHDTYLVFDLIKEFLQNAGQGQMVLQCIQSEKELCELCLQQTQLTRACLDLLEQYAAIVRYFPMSHANHHRTSLYHRWASTLLDNFSLDSCDLVLGEAKVCLAPPQLVKAPLIVSYNLALQRLLAEARAGVSKQLERGPPTTAADPPPPDIAAPTALRCIVVTALCNLNKRFLMLESAANSAMECLVDLTSQKGEWFFDEMCMTVGIMVKLLSLLPTPESDSPLHAAIKCLHAAHSQYKTLQELNLNFTSIILPEAIQKIHMEDPSVLGMVGELEAIIASVQVPLSDLVAQLQRHLHFVIMGMESPHAASQEVARQLQAAVDGLVQQSGDPLTPGQMLFMGFNGLFVNLTMGSSSLVAALAALNTPAAWKNIDQLRDAKMLAAPVQDPAPRAVLDSIFLVKRLQAMQELFGMCRANVEAFKGLGVTLPCDDDRFHRPIRCFIADYVSCQLLGVFSHTLAITACHLLQQVGLNVTGEVEQREVGAESRVPLEDLCRLAIDQSLRQGEVTSTSLSQASGAVQGVEGSVRVALAAARRTQELARTEAAVLRTQNQLTAHCWLHEDLLAAAQVAPPPTTLNRQALMLELRKMCAGLLSTHPRLLEAHEQQNSLVASAEQRLKWAAGANPALAEVMCAFETAVNNNNEQLLMEQRLANLVAGICNSVLHYEALRTHTSDAVNSDSAFIQLVEGSKQSCLLYQSLNTQLTPLEESLVKLCPPDSQIDWTWIANAESLISDSVKMLMKQMEPQKIELFAACDAIKSKAITVRSLLSTQYRVMADVRTLLKTMVKFEEPGVGEYLTRYRAYTERLTTLIKTILGMDEFTYEKAQNLLQEIAVIQEETPGIYEELLRLGKEKEGEGKSSSKRPPLLRQDSVCVSPKRDPHTGKAVQERNAYAVSVWRRVRWKLEGKDPDPAHRHTVQEQVDWAINEATSLDNLALLYEGWTPWV